MKNANTNINKNLLQKKLLKKTKIYTKKQKNKKKKKQYIQITCSERTNIKFVLISVLKSAFPFRNKFILKQIYY